MIARELLLTMVAGAISVRLCLQFKDSFRSFYGPRRQLENAKIHPACCEARLTHNRLHIISEKFRQSPLIASVIFFAALMFFSISSLEAGIFLRGHRWAARKQGRARVMRLLVAALSRLVSTNWSHMSDSSETAAVLRTWTPSTTERHKCYCAP